MEGGNVISIYPNPANKFVVISSEVAVKAIEIYNLLGEKVFQTTSNNLKQFQTTIDVHHLPASIYFVKVKSETGSAVRKLVVQ